MPATPPQGTAAPRGISCRRCGSTAWYVIKTRPHRDRRIVRRRQCRNCGRRIITYEREA